MMISEDQIIFDGSSAHDAIRLNWSWSYHEAVLTDQPSLYVLFPSPQYDSYTCSYTDGLSLLDNVTSAASSRS